ncbi:MAG: PP2C family serine/threonine-protein phosphatase [Acinetobacter sp.]
MLEKNELGLEGQFVAYISQDGNLSQLSLLLHALRLHPAGLRAEISEPAPEKDSVHQQAAAETGPGNAMQAAQPDAPALQADSASADSGLAPAEPHVNSALSPIHPGESSAADEAEKNRRAEITDVFNQSSFNDPKFQADNARAGQAYQSRLSIISHHAADDVQFKAESFKFPYAHFYFDAATQQIHGMPEKAEELEFSFQYCMHQETRTASCKINVISDPRSLWKVIEPVDGQLFPKAHADFKCIDLDDYKIAAASRRGRSHEHGGAFRDDDFRIFNIPGSQWSVIAVADGAGSAEYSREGSRIAVDIVQNEFQRYLNEYTIAVINEDIKNWQVGVQDEQTNAIAKKLNQQFFNVYYEIYRSIIAQIEQQAQQFGVAGKAFSTTLLAAVVCRHGGKTFISAFSVGDGAISVYGQGHVRLMNAADGGEYAGQTKFLDRSIHQELGARIKIGCFADVEAVMLMTDGISDPLFETDAGLSNPQKWQALYQQIEPLLQSENAASALLDWMHFFTPGHHDDRTLAVLCSKNSA